MNKLKETIWNNEKKGGEGTSYNSKDATDTTTSATTSATGAVTRSSDIIYTTLL